MCTGEMMEGRAVDAKILLAEMGAVAMALRIIMVISCDL